MAAAYPSVAPIVLKSCPQILDQDESDKRGSLLCQGLNSQVKK